jgi:GT2 family glycosyltransferase
MPPAASRVAVVIITRDRVDELLHTLGRLRALPERPQIVVVDQGSRDGGPERVRRRFPDVRVIALDDDRGAAGRTVGACAVDAPYVAFADDDSWWAPGALHRAAGVLDAHPRVGLVAGRVLLGDGEQLDPACAAMAASPLPDVADAPGRRVLGFVACGAVVRRDAFLAVGGFHPRLGIGGEEQLLAADLAARGWALVYDEDVVAHHHPSPVRDHGGRRTQQVRNDLWFAWLRRRRWSALRATARAARSAMRDSACRAGLVGALGGARWVRAQRRPVPAWLEADFARLDGSGARQLPTYLVHVMSDDDTELAGH